QIMRSHHYWECSANSSYLAFLSPIIPLHILSPVRRIFSVFDTAIVMTGISGWNYPLAKLSRRNSGTMPRSHSKPVIILAVLSLTDWRLPPRPRARSSLLEAVECPRLEQQDESMVNGFRFFRIGSGCLMAMNLLTVPCHR